ncbi:hypothetical protein D5086_004124 [Populus alba]|uniref:Uncharacterized protein n=1 Tax=Populus alba TaxID=43335 RepID=A0ACC4CPG9_POPAL
MAAGLQRLKEAPVVSNGSSDPAMAVSTLQGFSGLEEKIIGDHNEESGEREYDVEEEAWQVLYAKVISDVIVPNTWGGFLSQQYATMLGSENNGTELRRANILRLIAVCTKDNLFFAQQAEKKMPI